MLILKGTVDQGQGYASGWLADPLFPLLLGRQIHPGSINVFASVNDAPEIGRSAHPFFRENLDDEFIHPVAIRQRGEMLARVCTVNGVAAFILRTEHPGAAYSAPGVRKQTFLAQPNTMFEVIGTAKIPGIAYGVQVEFAFDPDPSALLHLRVGPPPIVAP